MENSVIFSISGERISTLTKKIVADSVNYLVADFRFTSNWNSLLKTAIFKKDECVYHVYLENNSCRIPYEVLQEGTLYVSVFGVSGTTRVATDEVAVYVEKSGYTQCEPSAPTSDPYAYFLEQATSLAERNEDAAEDCGLSVQAANSSKQQAAGYSSQARQYSEAAGVSAAAASTSAVQASVNVLNEISGHNSNNTAHLDIRQIAQNAVTIARGKANSLVFDTEENLMLWVDGDYERQDNKTVDDLIIGDNLYVEQLGVPDYWWNGETVMPLGAEKPDFSDYYNKTQINAKIPADMSFEVMSESEYASAFANGTLQAGKIYFVSEDDEN